MTVDMQHRCGSSVNKLFVVLINANVELNMIVKTLVGRARRASVTANSVSGLDFTVTYLKKWQLNLWCGAAAEHADLRHCKLAEGGVCGLWPYIQVRCKLYSFVESCGSKKQWQVGHFI